MKFCFKVRITNIYIPWLFEYFIAILTHQEINWANDRNARSPHTPLITKRNYFVYTFANVSIQSVIRVKMLKLITYTNIFMKQLVNGNFACCVIA